MTQCKLSTNGLPVLGCFVDFQYNVSPSWFLCIEIVFFYIIILIVLLALCHMCGVFLLTTCVQTRCCSALWYIL